MKKIIIFNGLLIWLSTVPVTAGQITFEKLLLSSKNDPVVTSQDIKSARVEKSFSGIPGIDDFEFQIRNTGFNKDNFRYSISVNPKGILETVASNRYDDALIANKSVKRLYLLNLAIYNRYLTFIDLMEQKSLKILYKELLTLYDDRIQVLEKLAYSEDFEMQELIKEEKDRSKEMVFSLEIDKYISVLEQRVRFYLKDTSFSDFDTTGVVSINTIMKRIETTTFELDTNNPALNLYRTRLNLAQSRFKLEKAQMRHFLDDITFIYDNGDRVDELNRKYNDKDYDLNKSFALELGIRIPNLTLGGQELNKFKGDLLSEAENYEQIRDELSEKVRKDLADLKQLIAQYRYLSSRETEVDAEASLKKFLQIQGIDPLVLLDIRENIIKNQIDRTWIKYGIMRNYLYVIDNAGILSKTPLHNYLSENQDKIEW